MNFLLDTEYSLLWIEAILSSVLLCGRISVLLFTYIMCVFFFISIWHIFRKSCQMFLSVRLLLQIHSYIFWMFETPMQIIQEYLPGFEIIFVVYVTVINLLKQLLLMYVLFAFLYRHWQVADTSDTVKKLKRVCKVMF